MTPWLFKQRNRLYRFFKAMPSMVIHSNGYLGLFKQLAYNMIFLGFHGLKSFCRPFTLENSQERIFSEHQSHLMSFALETKKKILSGSPPDSSTKIYIILAPNFISNSAGIKCLYQLCHDLNVLGYPSFITGSLVTDPQLVAPLIDTHEAKKMMQSDFIAVYPETISGNPLRANTVARWALNRPGLLGGDKIYDDRELVFTYTNAFNDSIKNTVAGKLYLPTIDEKIFYNDSSTPFENRILECFYVGKSKWKDGLIDRNKVFEITRESPKKQELGKLLRASKRLYCFDNSTILAYEAVLCGCSVVIIPDGTQQKHHYENSELGIDGISWGMSEMIDQLPDTKKIVARYEQVKICYKLELQHFIKITQRGST